MALRTDVILTYNEAADWFGEDFIDRLPPQLRYVGDGPIYFARGLARFMCGLDPLG